jgi:hypothetical protein
VLTDEGIRYRAIVRASGTVDQINEFVDPRGAQLRSSAQGVEVRGKLLQNKNGIVFGEICQRRLVGQRLLGTQFPGCLLKA